MQRPPVKTAVFFDGLFADKTSINDKREETGENFGRI